MPKFPPPSLTVMQMRHGSLTDLPAIRHAEETNMAFRQVIANEIAGKLNLTETKSRTPLAYSGPAQNKFTANQLPH